MQSGEPPRQPTSPLQANERATAELVGTLLKLGLEPSTAIFGLSDALAGLLDERTRSDAQRALALEWIGAFAHESYAEPVLSDRNLMTVLTRRVTIDFISVIDAEDIARRFECSVAEVEGWVVDRSWYGYRLAGRLVVPTWQFCDLHARELKPISERWSTIVECIPERALPALVAHVMCSQDPLLQGSVPLSPRDYLIAGGPPWPVARSLLLYLDGSIAKLSSMVLSEDGLL